MTDLLDDCWARFNKKLAPLDPAVRARRERAALAAERRRLATAGAMRDDGSCNYGGSPEKPCRSGNCAVCS